MDQDRERETYCDADILTRSVNEEELPGKSRLFILISAKGFYHGNFQKGAEVEIPRIGQASVKMRVKRLFFAASGSAF